MNENLLSVTELAEKLNLPKSWIYSRTRQKGEDTIPILRCGKYVRFCLEDVLNWLQIQAEDHE